MKRIDFMEQLENLLRDISDSEREEALAYYNSYFDDAGEENESKVVQELGSPGKIAAIIKADLAGGSQEYGEYTEQGYQDNRVNGESRTPQVYGAGEQSDNQSRARRGYQAPVRKGGKGNLILLIIILIFASPFLLAAASAILGILVGIAGAAIGVLAALAGGTIAAIICGIVFIVVGAVQCVTNPGLGLLEIGGGLLCMAAGTVMLVLFLLIVLKFIPWFLRKVVAICQSLVNKGRRKEGKPV